MNLWNEDDEDFIFNFYLLVVYVVERTSFAKLFRFTFLCSLISIFLRYSK